MIHRYSVLCRRSILDQNTGQATLVDLVDTLSIDADGDAGSIQIYSSWYSTTKGVEPFTVHFVDPNGNVLTESPQFTADFEEAGFSATVVFVPRFKWDESGEYAFRVTYQGGDGQSTVTIPILVEVPASDVDVKAEAAKA